jgi:hypothetical protein
MGAAPTDPMAERRRTRRQLLVVIGVVLTFLGLALLAVVLPSDSAGLARLLPYAAGAAIALWLGGILLGRGMAGRGPRRRG